MNPAENQKESLFREAIQRASGPERQAFLNGACAGDESLRQRLEALIQVHESPDTFLEPNAGPSGKATSRFHVPVEEAPGARIGRYKLLEKIGEGGCGIIYVAEQEEPVRRRVALKVIKLGMDTRQVIARFEAERQALALMDHPNIAKVLDAGATETGRPYFVMELVKGISITRYCDENQMNTQGRLNLFIQVCHAIQHAHQKGIIHRDLKPSNILVANHDGVPVPKVIDFGIAKATTDQRLTDKTLYTAVEQFIGTPAYMSPEQANLSGLDVDTRSDIYSLGVLLYELLTGRTPFDTQELIKDGLDALRRTIREVEPPRPSKRLSTLQAETLTATSKQHGAESMQLLKLVRGDLDWIVMKCLEKDRMRRYETANGLALDLLRHVHNEPVLARPPSNAYRFQKWVGRNKVAFAAAALIAAVLLAAALISVWQAVRASRAEKLAKQRLTESEANATLATQRLAESEAVSKFLTEVFQSPDPARDGRTITVAETLSNATVKLDSELTNQPERRAKLQATIARTYNALGLYREAIQLQEKVRDYYLTNSGPEHTNTLGAMNNLANSYWGADRQDEALKLREEVLALRRKVSGPEHPDTLGAMNNLADSYDTTGRRDEALKLREEVLALRRKVNGPEHPDTLIVMNDLAFSYSEAGRRDEALKLREQVLALRRKVLGPEHPDTLQTMNDLADSYDATGRRDEALKLREEVLALRRKVQGPEHPDTLGTMNNLADSYDEAGRHDEALKLKEELLALRRKAQGPEHPDTLNAMNDLAALYVATGRLDEAIRLREELLAVRRKLLGPKHPDTLWAVDNLANSYFAAGRKGEAIALLANDWEVAPNDTGASLSLAIGQLWFGQETDYEATRRRVVQLAEGTDQAGTAERAAKVYCLRPSTNAALLARVLKLANQAVELGKNDAWLPSYQFTLGLAEYRNSQYAAAERTLLVSEQNAGGNHGLSTSDQNEIQVTARLFRAMSLFKQNKLEEARKVFSQAEAQMPPLPKDESKPIVKGKSFARDTIITWLAYKEAKATLNEPAAKP